MKFPGALKKNSEKKMEVDFYMNVAAASTVIF